MHFSDLTVLPTDELGSVADKLTKIVDNVDLVPDVVCDSRDGRSNSDITHL